MPITKSAKKAIRQTQKRTAYNKEVKEEIKKAIKHAKKAIESGSKDIQEKIKTVQKMLDKAAKKGIYHKNTASRKLSRLIKGIKKGRGKKEKTVDIKKASN